MPKWLRVIHTFETKLLIEWISGFSGVESRVFVLEFRKYDEMYWTSVEVNETDKQSDLQSFELTNLNGSQTYNIRIFSKNSFGRSQFSKMLTVSTAYFDENIVKGLYLRVVLSLEIQNKNKNYIWILQFKFGTA